MAPQRRQNKTRAPAEEKRQGGDRRETPPAKDAARGRPVAPASMEQPNRRKSPLPEALSGDFRTPLDAVLAFSELLRQEGPSPRAKAHAEKIRDAGLHLLQLVDGLSGGESGAPRRAQAPCAVCNGPAPVRPLAVVEQDAIERAIEAAHGNVARAAELLGIDRATIYRKRRKARRGDGAGISAADLDAAALEALEASLGKEALRALVARHLDDLPGMLAAVTAAEGQDERAEALSQVAEIKSLAGAFGAVRLRKIAAELEAAWTGSAAESAPDLLKQLTQAGEAARAALAGRYGIALTGGGGQSPYQPSV